MIQTRERSEIPVEATWNLLDLYPFAAAWEADLAKLTRALRAIRRYRGKLGASLPTFARFLAEMFELSKRYGRLHTYAERFHDQDARVAAGQAANDRVQKLGTELDAALSFAEPEILRLPQKKLKSWLGAPAVADYRPYIENLLHRRPHVLSDAEETLIAQVGDLAATPENVHRTLSTVNLPYPEITLSDGEKVILTPPMYQRYRAVADRGDRRRVFQAYWTVFKGYRESFAALLSGVVSKDHYAARARKYKGDLECALDRTRVPAAVYHGMLDQVRAARPLLHRAMRLQQRLLKLPELCYHDLYASIVPSLKMDIPYEQAKPLLDKALAPLGPPYQELLGRSMTERWIDVYPSFGKRSGAYSAGAATEVHPYVLLNYTEDYDSLSTLAHELGHALHSALSNRHQPYPKAHYPIFTAEVASTTNEHLLRLHLLATETDPARRLFLLAQQLEDFRTVVFRQAQFAEFELLIHTLSQKGTALTADCLDEHYLKLLKETYGADAGVIQIDPLYAVEWAYIPHFYYNFYMFQYATSFIAATAIAARIFACDTRARDRYLAMLRAGGSKLPIELLKIAGVDMRKSEPYREAFASMAQTLDEIERLTA